MAPPRLNFDGIAPAYDALSSLVFGDVLLRAQRAWLPLLPPDTRVLVVGGGTGAVLPALPRRAGGLYLESSAAMLRRARRRAHPPALSFRHGDERALQPDETFDAVLTFFVLDLFPPPALAALGGRLRAALRPGGQWFFADFDPRPDAPPYQRALVRAMYAFFGVTSGVQARRLPDFAAFFRAQNLALRAERRYCRGMVRSAVYRAPHPVYGLQMCHEHR